MDSRVAVSLISKGFYRMLYPKLSLEKSEITLETASRFLLKLDSLTQLEIK